MSATPTTAADRTASWTVTTQSDVWSTQAPAALDALEVRAMEDFPSVMIRSSEQRQRVDGFGACFNELGWRALQRLPEPDREAVLDAIFLPGAGLNLTLCRMPLGANDFSLDWYSYDEVAGDHALEHFSVEHDEATLIPFIHAAKERQPDLRVWASPWSPPTWLKANGHYAAAEPFPASGVENGIRPDQVGREGTDMALLDEAHLDTYARYFGRFIEEYRARGIDVFMVMPQNEYNSPQVFPSCTWTPEGLAAFLRVLGPRMAALGVEVFLGTTERPDARLVLDTLADPEVARWVSGAGFQWAGKRAIADVRTARPDLALYQTEQECGDGRNDWRFARHAWSLMRHFLTNGTSGYCYWNIALDEGGVSRWGWAQNSLVVVDPGTGGHRFTYEYAVLRHVSGFVQPGAVRLEAFSWSGYENQLAFRNPDGTTVIVVQNDMADPMPYVVSVDQEVMRVVLPADSLSTFVLPAPDAAA
ncbi:glycoside hydrolase family 30 beta sandwich domain-containing protein [Demequina sp. SYSU T00068]|uniref:glycoside hydrolase family 30 protein n=1 Tax=Demequina lignilytica TaxID=3051663 RepID=UPI002622178C|nr:glycoside hydrolase family 30 beta sandwich domain-containing protein [Demequina sp. SYSU T00068]MDN4490494.1 glycoside hydrolase family 30 beta sandwich domain-containing protein [Demequina sp. SYSU T00068]